MNDCKRLHEQLTRSEKLTALGEMAAGVAHEINNPLGGILLYSNLVLEDIPEEGTARENMKKIIHQTNRCKNIVQGLLDFARNADGRHGPLCRSMMSSARPLNLVKDQSDLSRHRGRSPLRGKPARGERRSLPSGGGVPQSVHQCRRRDEGEGRQAQDHDLVHGATGSR